MTKVALDCGRSFTDPVIKDIFDRWRWAKGYCEKEEEEGTEGGIRKQLDG